MITFAQYVFNKDMHRNTLFTVTKIGGFYVLNGLRYTEQEFEKLYPITITPKMDNKYKKDSAGVVFKHQQGWMNGSKSY